jgi:1,4-dihydroxy-2-naphthoate octaprenyltransferase
MELSFGKVVSLVKPLNLLLAGLAYLLGVSVAKYLGITVNISTSIFGGVFVIFMLASSSSLDMYFSPPSRNPAAPERPQEREDFRRFTLYLSIGFLAFSAVSIFFLLLSRTLNIYSSSVVIFCLAVSLVNAVPPLRLMERGFGELAMALIIAGLPVMLGFTLQAMSFHRLVMYLSFPLVFITLAYLLALDFPSYATDQKFGHQSLLVRLTWQRAVSIHNLLLIVSYLIFLTAPLFGIPSRLIWPTLLTLPLAIYQIVILRNISLGLKPNWRVLTVNATALIGIVIYLLLFTFWVR